MRPFENLVVIKSRVQKVENQVLRSGKDMALLTLDCDEVWKKSPVEGAVQVKAFGRAVPEALSLMRGDMVTVVGKLQGKHWNDKVITGVTVDSLTKTGHIPYETEQAQEAVPMQQAQAAFTEDEIPF